MIMWTMYLSNTESGWKKNFGAVRVGKIESSLETDQALPNPFRAYLPPELLRSEYREFDEIVY